MSLHISMTYYPDSNEKKMSPQQNMAITENSEENVTNFLNNTKRAQCLLDETDQIG